MLDGNTLRGSLTGVTYARGELAYKGERGYSAYEIAVQNGYTGTEQQWIDHFGLDLSDYLKTTDVIDGLTSTSTSYPLSAKQGKVLKDAADTLSTNVGTVSNLTTTSNVVVGAINEVNASVGTTNTKIGDLVSLNTTNKTSVVNAINEVNTTATTKTYCRFGTANSITLTTSSTDFKVPLSVQQYNNGFSVNDGAIVCPRAGVVCLSAAVMMGVWKGYAGLKIRLNGTQILDAYAPKSTLTYGEIVSPIYTIPVAQNDTIELYVSSSEANDQASNSTRTGINIFYI